MKNYLFIWTGKLSPLKSEIAFIINIINFSEQEDSKTGGSNRTSQAGWSGINVLQSSAHWTAAR